MATSPNVLNYQVGKGTVTFHKTGGSLRDLGNCPELEITPNVTKLDHFSSRAGLRTKDRSIVIETGATLRMVLDEITVENLALQLLGDTITTLSGGGKSFDILAAEEIEGELVFTGTNSVGNQITMTLNSVSFTPSGSLSLISDEWNQIEVTGEVLAVAGEFGTVVVVDDV